MFRVRIYYGEELAYTTGSLPASDAILAAYNAVEGYPGRTAHIIKEGTRSGIYIARHDDLSRRGGTIPTAIAQLESMKWDSRG